MTVVDLQVSSDRGFESERRPFLMTPCETPDAVRIVVAGHSHGHAISRALISRAERGEVADPQAIALTHGIAGLMGAQFSEDFRGLLAGLAQTRDVALCWRGNQHNGDFLIMPGTRLDFVPRSWPDGPVDKTAQIVPEAAIRAHFQPSMDELAGILHALGRAAGRRHLVLGTPPPMQDQDELRRRLGREPAFGQRAAALGLDLASVPLASASLRRKLWHVIQEMMAETAAAAGALFVPVPPGCLDADGYLRPDMSGGDITHGNERYGRLMLAQIAAHLSAASRLAA